MLETIISYIPLYTKAFFLTVRLGLTGILLAVLLGGICSLVLYLKIPIFSLIVKVYIELFRNTPLLIQLFFIYFGLPKLGIRISAEVCGILGLMLLGGSYMAESFRSGLETVDRIQKDTSYSLSMSVLQTFFYIVLPEALSVSVPALTANIIFLLKETSVFSAVSLMDLMFTAKDLIGLYYRTTECLLLLVLFYCLMLLPVSFLGSFIEKKLRFSVFGDNGG